MAIFAQWDQIDGRYDGTEKERRTTGFQSAKKRLLGKHGRMSATSEEESPDGKKPPKQFSLQPLADAFDRAVESDGGGLTGPIRQPRGIGAAARLVAT